MQQGFLSNMRKKEKRKRKKVGMQYQPSMNHSLAKRIKKDKKREELKVSKTRNKESRKVENVDRQTQAIPKKKRRKSKK